MVRRDVESLIARLSQIEGIEDLAMTTNAHFLRGRAQGLKDAGLQRITISLDSLDAERFALLTGRNELKQVLDGIDAAIGSGNACQRPVGDQSGEIDRSGGNGRDHLADRSAMRRLRRGPIEM